MLEAAGLVTTTWRGREKLHHLDAAPINAIAERWMTRYDRRRAGALADLKRAPESGPMNEFAYPTYISTTPEKLWQALTDPAFTRQHWGGAKTTDPDQVVLESDPHRRLSYTWHTFTSEWAKSVASTPKHWLRRRQHHPVDVQPGLARTAVEPEDALGDRRPPSVTTTYRPKRPNATHLAHPNV